MRTIQSPIYGAAEYGRYEIINFLVEAGIDPNIQTEDYTLATPFRYAWLAGADYDTIKYLLKQGADINEVSAAGYTCLSAAVARDDEKVVKLLEEWEAYGDVEADVKKG
ncbi:hypothetical protein TCAL_17344 [Tigriopus californicus]|uniref:Uncharacterized protein n=1 Tax=Tigriopus californicus TaxID=6832 RepID=A0A553NZY8_TIGCA|nr:hypothetical protein TCAL_17344 [Tigriopus californicus]